MALCKVQYFSNGDLTEECLKAMLLVRFGADVFDIHEANLLRFVEINHPEYIVIGRPMHEYPELEQQPIFAAKLTEAGREYIDALHRDKEGHEG